MRKDKLLLESLLPEQHVKVPEGDLSYTLIDWIRAELAILNNNVYFLPNRMDLEFWVWKNTRGTLIKRLANTYRKRAKETTEGLLHNIEENNERMNRPKITQEDKQYYQYYINENKLLTQMISNIPKEIPAESLAKIGDRAGQEAKLQGDEYILLTSNHMDWEQGEWQDNNSCYWEGYVNSRYFLGGLGHYPHYWTIDNKKTLAFTFRALKLRGMDDVNLGRCHCIYVNDGQEGFFIFNAYGKVLLTFARILGTMLNLPYNRCNIITPSDQFYVNGKNGDGERDPCGWWVGAEKRAIVDISSIPYLDKVKSYKSLPYGHSYDLPEDAPAEEEGDECCHCGRWSSSDYVIWVGDDPYCSRCAGFCAHCDEASTHDDLYRWRVYDFSTGMAQCNSHNVDICDRCVSNLDVGHRHFWIDAGIVSREMSIFWSTIVEAPHQHPRYSRWELLRMGVLCMQSLIHEIDDIDNLKEWIMYGIKIYMDYWGEVDKQKDSQSFLERTIG